MQMASDYVSRPYIFFGPSTKGKEQIMQPWPIEKRSRVTKKIEREAARAAARLGAENVVIIAFFKDGEYMHMQDAGTAPMPLSDLYKKMVSARDILGESGGEDVALQ
jgi:hypothetical protein